MTNTRALLNEIMKASKGGNDGNGWYGEAVEMLEKASDCVAYDTTDNYTLEIEMTWGELQLSLVTDGVGVEWVELFGEAIGVGCESIEVVEHALYTDAYVYELMHSDEHMKAVTV